MPRHARALTVVLVFAAACGTPPVEPTVPSRAAISGLETGTVGVESLFTCSADLVGAKLRYDFDWGDGAKPESFTRLRASGSSFVGVHVYETAGGRLVKCRAVSEAGVAGDWSVEAAITIVPGPVKLTVARVGEGLIVSHPSGINCGATCEASFPPGSRVTLDAEPAQGWAFSGWSGACSGAGTPALELVDPVACTATFERLVPVELTVTGHGLVKSTPVGLSCPDTCRMEVAPRSTVTLQATPDANHAITGWTGDCASAGATLKVVKTAPFTCGATFDPILQPLVVQVTGEGHVTADAGGLDCPGTCERSYPQASVVHLEAKANAGHRFRGWSGDCQGEDARVPVTLAARRTCKAEFAPDYRRLTLVVAGSGTVSSTPAGLSCPTTCRAEFPPGASVRLAVAPAAGWRLEAWGTTCASADRLASTVRVDEDLVCEVRFTDEPIDTPPREIWSRGGHWDAVNAVDWSAAGRIATAAQDGLVRVWDAASGSQVWARLDSPVAGTPQRAVAFSPDGARVASGGQDNFVTLRASATGVQELALRHDGAVTSIAWSADGTRVAAGSLRSGVRVWNATTGAVVLSKKVGTPDAAVEVVFTADGRLVTAWNGALSEWDPATGESLASRFGSEGVDVRVSRSGLGAVLHADQTITLHDADGAILQTLAAPSLARHRFAWNADGTQLAVALDEGLEVWDAANGTLARTLTGSIGATSLAFSPDGTELVTGARTGGAGALGGLVTIRPNDAEGTPRELTAFTAWATSAEFNPDATRVAVASRDGLTILDATNGRTLAAYALAGASRVAWSPDGKLLAARDASGKARLLDAATGVVKFELDAATHEGGSISFSADGKRLATAGAGGNPKFWDTTTGALLKTLVPSSSFDAFGELVRFDPAGKWFVTSDDDSTARPWDAGTYARRTALSSVSGTLTDLEFDPAGARLVGAGSNGSLSLWTVGAWTEIGRIDTGDHQVTDVAWSGDGQRLATIDGQIGADHDGQLRLWSPRSGRGLNAQAVHGGWAFSVAWSRNGARLVTTGPDAVTVWDVAP